MARKCTKCLEMKPIDEFYLNCYGRNGLCRSCVTAKNKEYYERKKADIAAKHAARKAAGVAPVEGLVEQRKAVPFHERYAQRRAKVNENKRERLHADPEFRRKVNVDNAMRRAFASEGELLEKRVGCTADWFQEWIEYQLTGDMTPDNYRIVWTYDHVIPRSAFNFRDPEEVKKCNHWSNWRPLLCAENSAKYNKRDPVLEEQHAMTAYIFELLQN